MGSDALMLYLIWQWKGSRSATSRGKTAEGNGSLARDLNVSGVGEWGKTTRYVGGSKLNDSEEVTQVRTVKRS